MDILASSISSPFECHGSNTGVHIDASSLCSYLNGKDGEIGIFRAERYFNGGMDKEDSQRSTVKNQFFITHTKNLSNNLWLGTRSSTVDSGQSSTSSHSQKALLQSYLANSPTVSSPAPSISTMKKTTTTQMKKSTSSRSFLSSFRYCKCYSCKDENSVDVGEISFSNNATTKLQCNINCQKKKGESEFPIGTSSFRENHFTFPIVKVTNFQDDHEMQIERKSLEVFGSPVKGRLRNKSLSLEKRLAVLSLSDHTVAAAAAAAMPTTSDLDEINSDCSSDLFEIESLTNKSHPFISQSGSVTPTTCYAPSEVSVDWSVVTASAIDFDERRPSTATFTSPARFMPTMNIPKSVNVNKEDVDYPKRRASALLGCNNLKAIRVAGDAHMTKYTEPNSDQLVVRRNPESSLVVKMFEDKTKVGGFSFRSSGLPPSHRALATLTVPRPYSPRLSNNIN